MISTMQDGNETHATFCPSAEPPAEFRQMLEHRDAMSSKQQERRALPRWPYAARVRFTAPDGDMLEACTCDINICNAGFVSARLVDVGTHGSLQIDLSDGGCFETQARVMRCREFAPGCFEGYLNFSTNLPEPFETMIRSQGN